MVAAYTAKASKWTNSALRSARSLADKLRRTTQAQTAEHAAATTNALATLETNLAASLDDSSRRGTAAAKRFKTLSLTVRRILATEFHARALRLQAHYEALDPTRNRAADTTAEADAADDGNGTAGSSSSAASAAVGPSAHAAAFAAALDDVLREAGFRLCSAGDVERAHNHHFGDENIWQVPVTIEYEKLDSSLVRSFDPYEAAAAAGRRVPRPAWADKLPIYTRGLGSTTKRGYFVFAKVEEMARRKLFALLGSIGRVAASAWYRLSGGGDGALERRDDASFDGTMATLPLTWRTLFEESVLTAPTYGHVMVMYRSVVDESAARAERAGSDHIALGLFRDVPRFDLELVLPHPRVDMPPLQRAQFIVFSGLGACAGWPLLFNDTLSYTGLISLYTLAALAARTAVRWRFSKQFYSQLLVSYQSSSRLGASDGALLYAVRLAEAEQTKQAILALHGLLREQLRSEREPNRVGAPGLDLKALTDHAVRVLTSWSSVQPLRLGSHCTDDTALRHLERIGVVCSEEQAADGAERVSRGGRSSSGERVAATRRYKLKPLDEALSCALQHWQGLVEHIELDSSAQTTPQSPTVFR